MINSKEILYDKGANDECVTLDYAVRPIIKYISKSWVVWCPFDTEKSEFVKQLKNNGNKVIQSHISEGKDFYVYEPNERWDCIISNPPFTNKRKIFERALSFNKPFALIMSNTWLNDSAPKQLFEDKDLQLLMFDKRMRFINNGVINNKITFSCSYYCYKLLPKQIIMEKLVL
ncbi:MAG: tRNA (adenine-N(6)-)-methyltransferase [Clostridiales bacterium]|nr:tRNA (adenine-N(6)-)-methyltransferase [Clostridiales bacterium]